jgi:glycosyltransferase involved in cell wall biosynthesis
MIGPGAMAVATLGARMHYALPRQLYEKGALTIFYTDLAVDPAVATLGSRVGRRLGWKGLEKLAGRSPGLPRNRVKSFPAFGFSYAHRLRRATNDRERLETYLWGGSRFCQKVVEHWALDSAAMYTCNSAGLEALDWLARRGGAGVLEQTSAPRLQWVRLLSEASVRFPGWNDGPPIPSAVDRLYAERERQEWSLAKVILAGSGHVRDLIVQDGGPAEKIRVVPYGFSPVELRERQVRSHHARVPCTALFVGRVSLGKGAPVLAAAARKLANGPVRFRMVGPIDVPEAARHELQQVTDLVGPVPRSSVLREMSRADLFVFPSFCEGSAVVCYEALAAGLPVVTTPTAGSVVRDGIDGFIVPPGDAEALAEKVELLAHDNELRDSMSVRAKERAQQFTTEKYGERVLVALEPVLRGG